MLMAIGFTYILECSDGSYYTGSTKNLFVRLQEHAKGRGANHTKKRVPVQLVYFEVFPTIHLAFRREKQIQKWTRRKKEALIKKLYDELPRLSRNYTQFGVPE
jgi:putative endonuclease